MALPVLAAGLVHVAVIKTHTLPRLARLPLDGGLRVRGRRVLGDHKTVRGAVVMISCTALFALLLSWVPASMKARLSVAPFQLAHAALWGLLLGTGYILGELPNSFIKRQLGIAPGAAARGWQSKVFWVADQIDSVAGIFLLLWLVWTPDAMFVAFVFALALLLHPLVAALMVLLGLKRRIG